MRLFYASLAALTVVIALAGCTPEPELSAAYEQPRQVVVTKNRSNYVAYVDAQTGEMSAEEQYRMVTNLRSFGPLHGLSVSIQESQPAGHTRRLVQTLVSSGISARQISVVASSAVFPGMPGAPPAAPHPRLKAANVAVDYFTAEVPGCPDWRRSNLNDGSNAYSSNFGCSNLSNFTRMIVNPGDIVGGVPSGTPDGARAADAVRAYQEWKTALPPPADQPFIIRPGRE